MKQQIKNLLGVDRRKHWVTRVESVPFKSGLGDSAWLLHGLCRSMKPNVCVEIGSARGKSACYLALALRENGHGHLYAIDPHAPTNWNDSESVDTYELIRENLAQLGLEEFVTLVRKDSVSAAKEWTKPIDLIFIDGDHSYDGAKADWLNFSKFVNPFGLVVFHDTLWDLRPDPRYQRADMGVPRLVDELRREGYPVLTIDQDFGVSVVQPRKHGVVLTTAS